MAAFCRYSTERGHKSKSSRGDFWGEFRESPPPSLRYVLTPLSQSLNLVIPPLWSGNSVQSMLITSPLSIMMPMINPKTSDVPGSLGSGNKKGAFGKPCLCPSFHGVLSSKALVYWLERKFVIFAAFTKTPLFLAGQRHGLPKAPFLGPRLETPSPEVSRKHAADHRLQTPTLSLQAFYPPTTNITNTIRPENSLMGEP